HPPEAVYRIGSGDFAAFAFRNSLQLMEIHVAAQVKGIGLPVGTDFPAAGHAGLNIQVAVELNKPAVQLAYGPDGRLVLGKCRVEGSNACIFIIGKHLLLSSVTMIS